jgi:hypothetical protein
MRKHTPEEATAAREHARIRSREYKRKWAVLNKDKIHASYIRCKQRHRASMRAWYKKNKQAAADYAKKWNAENREKRVSYKRKYHAKYSATWEYKLRQFASNQVAGAIMASKSQKSGRSIKYLGCSIRFFKLWIESKFESWMTWENHGQWHIDHIIPLCTIKSAADDEAIRSLLHYSNLRPISAHENLTKQRRQLPYVQPELPIEISA